MGQIFYLADAGKKIEELKTSVFAEKLHARGYEVLYMDDPIDEIVLQHMGNFEGKSFQNVAKSSLKLGDEDTDAESEKDPGGATGDLQPDRSTPWG